MSLLSDIKKTLRERNLHLNKKLGQHLLIDANARRKFVETAELSGNDLVIEIGPGTGLITEEIAHKAGYTVAIEIDRGLAGYLREKFSHTENLSILHQAILKCDLSQICYQAVRKSQIMQLQNIKVVGSLPFNINAEIIQKIVESRIPLNLCVFVMQKEVAERYAAPPGTKLYGPITIYLQYRFTLERAFSIPKKCFFPTPEVDSAVIRMIPHSAPPVEIADEELFSKIVRTAFNQRRKMLKNSLSSLESFEDREDDIDAAFIAAGISPKIRPEKLSLEQFARIANALSD